MAYRGCTKGVILIVKATYLSGSTFGVLLRGSHTDEIGTSTVLYLPSVIGVRTFVRTRVVPLEGSPLRAIHTLDLSTVDDTVLRALSEYFLTEMMKPIAPVKYIVYGATEARQAAAVASELLPTATPAKPDLILGSE